MPPLRLTHPNMVLLLRELDFGPGTIHDLRDALGIELRSTQRAVNAARRFQKVRIVSWERAQGGRPVYGLGAGKDARRPRPLTAAEKKRRWRARQRCLPEVRRVAGQSDSSVHLQGSR